MKIGLISDIHGNLPGLTAAFAYLEELGVDDTVCLGDLVQFGPYPSQVVDFVREKGIATVQGNCDRAVARGRADTGDDFDNVHWERLASESLQWTMDQLSLTQKKFLKKLPAELRYRIGHVRILCVHGLPGNVCGRIRKNASMEVYRFMLQSNSCDVLALGHTHEMFLRSLDRGMIFNPGSVGGGTVPGCATAGVLEIDEASRTVAVSWHRIPYDMEMYERKYKHEELPGVFLKCMMLGRDPRGRWLTDDINRRQRWAEQ